MSKGKCTHPKHKKHNRCTYKCSIYIQVQYIHVLWAFYVRVHVHVHVHDYMYIYIQFGWTPLHHAARNGNVELCKLLVSNDCRPHLQNMVRGGTNSKRLQQSNNETESEVI